MVGLTGATGYLGNVVARSLLQRNESVRMLVRSKERLLRVELPTETSVVGDLLDSDSLARCFDGCEAVVHAAALVSVDGSDADELRRVNIEGTRHVIEACLRVGVRRLVSVGSVEAFDLSAGGESVIEVDRLDPRRPILEYGRTKATAINDVLDADGADLATVVVSPTALLGPRDYRPSPMGRFIRAFLGRKLPAFVRGGFDFVDVRDVAAACISAVYSGVHGRHYPVSGRYLSVRELLEMLESVSGVPMPRVCIPDSLAMLFGTFSASLSPLFGRSAVITPEVVRLLLLDVRISSETAGAELGYRARDIRETVTDTVSWFRERTG